MTTGVLLLLVLSVFCASCSAGSLTDLYNSQVSYAEYYTRPLSSSSSDSGSSWFWKRRKRDWNHSLEHAGVVVTTSDGKRWLIHKGSDYGDTWDTVITDANHMSSQWTREKCGNVYSQTVNDFMQAAKIECSYNLLSCNCQHAANGMWKLVSGSYNC